MRYDLKCNKCHHTFMIQCSWDKRKDLVKCQDLKEKILHEEIDEQHEHSSSQERLLEICDGDLETDWTTQKPIRHNINWPSL